MSTIYSQLAQRIRDEVETLDQVVDRALVAWERAQNAPGEQASARFLDQLTIGEENA